MIIYTAAEIMAKVPIDYGIIVAIVTAIAFALLIPLKIMAKRNGRKKREVAPLAVEIKKKYGINMMGASVLEDIENPSEEIRSMSNDAREQKAAEEIEAMYREKGYRVWTGWIPGIALFILIILLYFGITSFCPEGEYKEAVFTKLFSGDVSGKIIAVYMIYFAVDVLHPVIGMLLSKRPQKWYVTAITSAITLGLMIFVAWKVIPALLVGITVLRACSALYDIVEYLVRRNENATENNNDNERSRRA